MRPGRGRASSQEAVQAELGPALADSINHHLVADVPVGIFLSSGLDSSTITALACRRREARGSCIPSPWDSRNYGAAAAMRPPMRPEIAARYGTMHQTQWITREDFHRRLSSHPGSDGPTRHRRGQYVFCRQGGRGRGHENRPIGPGGRRTLGRLSQFSRHPPDGPDSSPGLSGFPGLGRTVPQRGRALG